LTGDRAPAYDPTPMQDFPAFMKHPKNRIAADDQSRGADGYVFDGADGSQLAFWTCTTSGRSDPHTHDYDEYLVVLQGSFTLIIDGRETVLRPGDEQLIPRGVAHAGRFEAGTRTIHAFGGQRARREQSD
jgi:quercetin dioxygenase-like cupin family protein